MSKSITTLICLCGILVSAAVLSSPVQVRGADTGQNAPLQGHRFLISFDDIQLHSAVEVRGLSSESQVLFTSDSAPRAGDLKPVVVVVVRPMQPPDELWSWRAEIAAGGTQTRTGRIDILLTDGKPGYTLFLKNAWPFKWVWPDLDAMNPEPAMEEIHFLATEVSPEPSGSKQGLNKKDLDRLKKRSALDKLDEAIKGKGKQE